MRNGEVSTPSSIRNTGIALTPAIENAHNNDEGVVGSTFNAVEGSQQVSSGVYPTSAYGILPDNMSTRANSSGWGKVFNVNSNGDGTYFGNTSRNIKCLDGNIRANIEHMVEAKRAHVMATEEIENARGRLPEDTEFRTMPGVGAVCTINGVTCTVAEAVERYAVA